MSDDARSVDQGWRVIARFPNYAVSRHGQVKRLTSRTCAKAGSTLKQAWSGGRASQKGYLVVNLVNEDGRASRSVHLLVAEAFLGARPRGKVPNHKDGNRANNASSNLEWISQSENVRHAYRLGLSDAKGTANGQAKLSDRDVISMRAMARGQRGDYARIARDFDISPRQVADIIKGHAWPHLLAEPA